MKKSINENMTNVAGVDINKGKIDFTTLSEPAKAGIIEFITGTFSTSDELYKINAKIASDEHFLELARERQVEGWEKADEMVAMAEEHLAIDVKTKEGITRYKYVPSATEKNAYKSYKNFIECTEEDFSMELHDCYIEEEEDFSMELHACYIKDMITMYENRGLVFTNGALVNLTNMLGMRKTSVKAKATKRLLVKACSQADFYYMNNVYMAKNSGLLKEYAPDALAVIKIK